MVQSTPSEPPRARRRGQSVVSGAAILVLVLTLAPMGLWSSPRSLSSHNASAQPEPVPYGDVIVVLNERDRRTDPAVEAAEAGVGVRRVYRRAIRGFATTLTKAQAERLVKRSRVAYISPNTPVRTAAQTIPAGINRIGGSTIPVAQIDGVDTRVDADIAILDTGISASTGDLNVVGGKDCDGDDTGNWTDDSGHGTHVAGTLAALDNATGVVGVAPGARLWSVKVLPQNGIGSIENLLCGLDWVIAQVQNGQPIDAVNMSLTGSGSDGSCDSSALHEAICNVVNAGVPVIAAAGNGINSVGVDASTTTPATYSEVIAVSAFNDFNGLPGGGATKPVNCSTGSSVDDAFATYSNYGADVDIAAPGTCVLSLALGGGLAYRSGTSMAAPHVTGAVALFKSVNHNASPSEVRTWLLNTASQAQDSSFGFTGDPDSSAERVLYPGNTSIATFTPTATPVTYLVLPITATDRSANSLGSSIIRDGNISNIWKTNSATVPTDAWVSVDLGTTRILSSIRWIFGQTGLSDALQVQISNNKTTWSTVTTRGNASVGNWQSVGTSASARYIRWYFTNPNSDVQIGGLGEVQIRGRLETPTPTATATSTPTQTPTLTPTQTATTGPTSSVLPITATNRSSNALGSSIVRDGNISNIWKTNSGTVPTDAWVYVDLGSIKDLFSIRWIFAQTGIADAFQVQFSTNKSTWTTVSNRSNASVGNWQSVGTSASARYIRWYFTNPNNDSQIGGLGEVQVRGYTSGPSSADVATETPIPISEPTTPPTVTPEPSRTETVEPSITPMPTQTATVAPTQTAAPTNAPSEEASGTPTDEPTSEPTETATAEPASPTEESASPTEEIVPTAESDTVEVEEAPTPYIVARTIRTRGSERGNVVIDGDPATVWYGTPQRDATEVSVTLDLGRPRTVGTIRLLISANGLTGDLRVETSRSRQDWVEIPSAIENIPSQWVEITPEGETTSRFVKVTFTSSDGSQVGGIAEIEVWP